MLESESHDPDRSQDVRLLAFSEDGAKILSFTYEEFRAWDAKSGNSLKPVDITPSKESFVIAFSPDGSSLAEYDSRKKAMRIKGMETARSIVTLEGDFPSFGPAGFSPDSSLFAASDRNELIHVWDVKSGKLKVTLSGHQTRVEGLAFSLNGQRLASCGYEGIRVWDLETGNQITLLQGHQSTVKAVAFGADDKVIVSGAEDSTLRTWDIATAAHISLPQTHVIRGLAISRDGKFIAVGERSFGQSDQPRVLIYETSTLKVARVLAPMLDDIVRIDFSADGRQLIVSGASGMARIFDRESGEHRGTINGNHPVNAVAYSGDGEYLALGGRDGYVTVWAAKTLEPLWSHKGHEDIIDQMRFSPDSRYLVTGSWDKTVKVWDAGTGLNLNTLKGHNQAVFGVSFNGDGNDICSASLDGTIKIWHGLKNNEPETLRGHTSGVTDAVFSLDGKRIFSGSADTSLRLWDATAKEFITVLRDAAPLRDWNTETGVVNAGLRNANFGIQSLAISSDGTRLVATLTEIDRRRGGAKSYLMIWNTRLPVSQTAISAQPLAIGPKALEATPGPPTKLVGSQVIPLYPQSQFEVEQWFDQRTTHGVSILNFIRFVRYGGAHNQRREHELRYQKALALEGSSAKSYVRRGNAYLDRNDFALAIADFTDALRLEPDNADAFGLRGVAHYFKGDLREAVADLSKAISANAKDIDGYLLLRGNIFTQVDRFDLALPDFDQVVTLTPNTTLPLVERGKVHLKMHNYDMAVTDFSRAIRLDPHNPELYDYRGEALYQKGDLANAEKDFVESIRISNKFLSGHYHLACVLFDLGRYNEALSRWGTLWKLDPKMMKALAGQVITLDALGKKDQALKTLIDVAQKDDRFWHCSEELKDDYFWSKSGCRAISPVVEKLRTLMVEVGMEEVRKSKSK